MLRTWGAALVLAVLFAGRTTCFSWKACEDAPKSLYADIKAVTLTPQEPAAGDTVHFAIDGTAKIDVSAGSLDIGVMYSGLPIYSETRDLCDMASCPIKTGDLKIAYDQYLPPIVPPGPYVVTMNAADAAGKALLCLEISFDMAPPPISAGRGGSALGHAKAMLRGVAHA